MDVAALPYKIAQYVDGGWQSYRHRNQFVREVGPDGRERLRIGSAEPFELFQSLCQGLTAPLAVRVILHTPRAEPEGRYESPPLSQAEAAAFLGRFRGLFERDARADIAVRSLAGGDEAVLDKHDYVFLYGDLESGIAALAKQGYAEAEPELPFPHTHHYHEEFDLDAAAMLQAFEWRRTDLLPGDGD